MRSLIKQELSLPNKYFTLLLAFFVWFAPVRAELMVQRLGNEDGLANNTLYDIVQDGAGYIWLATTESGLQRYDGYRFMTFDVLDANENINGIQPDVGKLLIDSKQRLWVGTWGLGVSRLSPDRSKLSRFHLNGLQVQQLLETPDGSVWIGSTNGLYRIKTDDSVERIGAPDTDHAFTHQRIWGITEGENGEIWIGTSEGFYSWQQQQGLSAPILLAPTAASGSRDNEVRAIRYLDGNLWLGTRYGINLYDPKSQELQALARPDQSSEKNEFIINRFYPDNANNMLVGSYEGLFRFSLSCNCFIPFKDQISLLPTLNVRAILTDRSGVLWLGTRSHGLFYTRYGQSTFSELRHPALDELTKNYAFSVTNMVFTAEHELWLASGQHLYRLDLSTESALHLKLDSTINKLATDDNNTLYVATDQGVFYYSAEAGQLTAMSLPFTLANIPRPLVRDMLTKAPQQFWFGLWGNGVLFYDDKTGQTRHFLSELSNHHSGDAVEAMTLMADGTVWVGTRYSGLYQLDAQVGIKARLQHHFADALPSDKIQCLENNGASLLLICTNRGLVLWDLATDIKRFLDDKDGLASSNIVGAVIENQRIWVLTAKGISLISPETAHVVTFNRRDGLIAPELNSNAKAIDANGQLYFGSLQGVMQVNPESIWTNSKVPIPQITAIKINHGNAQSLESYANKPLVLAPDENTLEFQFSAMDYHDVNHNRFRYRLIGSDHDWIYAGHRPFTVYSNLQHGDYELQLMAMNHHGLISEQVASLSFRISPRWWQLWQVQVGFVIMLLLLLLASHRYRLRHIHQINSLLNLAIEEKSNSQRLLEEKVDTRTRELKEKTLELENSLQDLAEKNLELTRLDKLKDQFVSTVSHELRTPLTAIRGAITLMANSAIVPGTDNYQNMLNIAQLNGERLSQLISDLLDIQKFDSGTFRLDLHRINLNQLTREAVAGIQQYSSHFDVQIDWVDDGTDGWIMADPLRIRQVMDNFLSNAIKFSMAGQRVIITLQRRQDDYVWSVTDSGRGISAEFTKSIFTNFSQEDASNVRNREGSGLGLAISKKIIDCHQGRIGFSSTQGKGSTFWFSLPAADDA